MGKKRIEKLRFSASMAADETGVGNVYISGMITSFAWEEFNETDSVQVKRELEKVQDADTLNIYIDSPGGYLDEGMTMMRLIAEHPAKNKNAYCMECASAATLLCIPCTHVYAYEGAEFFFHLPRGTVQGTPDEIRNYAEGLQKRADSVAGLYNKRMKSKSLEEIAQMMKDETWLTPREAVECGFADEILPVAPQSGAITMCAGRTEEEENFIARMLGYKPRKPAALCAHIANPQTSADFKENIKEDKKMTLEELKNSAPELYEQVIQMGVMQERARMQALDGLYAPETADIINDAKYGEHPRTAPEAAMEILQSGLMQRSGTGYLSMRKEETQNMSNIKSGAQTDNDPIKQEEDEIRMMAKTIGTMQNGF